jgi:hypothetical protein
MPIGNRRIGTYVDHPPLVRTTDVWDEHTIPPGLTRAQRIAPGTWHLAPGTWG